MNCSVNRVAGNGADDWLCLIVNVTLDSIGLPVEPSAEITPDTLYATFPEGFMAAIVPSVSALITSTNAPANYSFQGIIGEPIFTNVVLMDTIFTTPDSVSVDLAPGTLTPGVYYNTVRYTVEGVTDPVELTICMTITPAAAEAPIVAIQSINDLPLGATVPVEVTLDKWGTGIGGFDLLIDYDANVLNFLEAIPGPEFYDLTPSGCGWEYFSYQAEGDDQIRVVGVADLNNGEEQPECTMAAPLPATLFTLQFMVTSDTTAAGQSTPINFLWVDCGDNAFASVTGESLYFDRAVYGADQSLIWNELDDVLYPEEARLLNVGTTDACFNAAPGSDVNVRYVDFFNGMLTIAGPGTGEDNVVVSPAHQTFYALAGMDRTQTGSIILSSGGSIPGSFTVRFLDDPDVVVLTDSLVYANDTLFFEVNNLASTSSGLYSDTLVFHYEGYPMNALSAIVDLVIDSTGLPSVSVSPSGLVFEAPADTAYIQYGSFFVSATGGPANFTVSILDDPDFTELIVTEGVTDDSVSFRINTGDGLAPGEYVDVLVFTVEGVYNSPGVALLYLTVGDSVGGEYSNATVSPMHQSFTVPANVPADEPGAIYVTTDKGPANFTVTVWDEPDFVELIDTIGVTDDSVSFSVKIPVGLPAGVYVDTLAIDVEGALFSRMYAVLSLEVGEDPLPSDSAWLSMEVFSYSIPHGSISGQEFFVLLESTNGPVPYSATVLGGDSSFVTLQNPDGQTGDSVWLDLDPTGLDAGLHVDSVSFSVEGIEQLQLLVVNLTLTITDSMPGFNLASYPNPFNPVANIVFSLPASMDVRLNVYNITGRLVTTLVDGSMEASEHTVTWDGSGHASGIYFYRLEAGQFTDTKKMVLLK